MFFDVLSRGYGGSGPKEKTGAKQRHEARVHM
jgi:hypothetical protein